MASHPHAMQFQVILKKKEDGDWVAHCLELDIVATGSTQAEAREIINSLIAAQVDYAFSTDNLAHLYHPAPAEVWAQLYKCKRQSRVEVKVKKGFALKTGKRPFVPSMVIARTCTAG